MSLSLFERLAEKCEEAMCNKTKIEIPDKRNLVLFVSCVHTCTLTGKSSLSNSCE